MDLGGDGFGWERPIILGGINRREGDFQHLFSDYLFIGGLSLGWSDLLKWSVSFDDKQSIYVFRTNLFFAGQGL